MIEFAIGIGLIVALIVTRKLWNKWLQVQSDTTELWVEDQKNDLQSDIKRVYDDRQGIITKNNGKWYSVEDIQGLEN
jgi:hypothetical protein